MDFW